MIVIDPVVLSLDGEEDGDRVGSHAATGDDGYLHTCQSHDYERMKPIVLAGWRLAQHSASRLEEGRSEVIAEARVLQETIQVPSSKASSRPFSYPQRNLPQKGRFKKNFLLYYVPR